MSSYQDQKDKDVERLMKETSLAIFKRYLDGKPVNDSEVDWEAKAILDEFLKKHPEYKSYEKEIYTDITKSILDLRKKAEHSTIQTLELFYLALKTDLNL